METKVNPQTANGKSILLRSDRLKVQIADPGVLYWGSRYDWTGFITQVILDEQHPFCVPESLVPSQGDGGVGLCGEFGIQTPVGFASARPGDEFPKLGVGLLTRPDDRDYRFSRRYAVRPFAMRVETTESRARFLVEAQPCRGYAARLEKLIYVEDNSLTIRCRLTNEGELPIRTEEYNHNFLAPASQPVGPGYLLELPFCLQRSRLSNHASLDALRIEGDQVRWPARPTEAFYLATRDLLPDTPTHWRLRHEPSGLGVTVSNDFPWAYFALYGTAHCICPEVFIALCIEPGETQTWTRHYQFHAHIS